METSTRYEARLVPKGTKVTFTTTESGGFVATFVDYKTETIHEDSIEEALLVANRLATESDMVLVSLTEIRETVFFEATPRSITTVNEY